MPDIFVSEDNLIEKESTDWRGKITEKKQSDRNRQGEQSKELQKGQEKQTIINYPVGPFGSFKVRPKGVSFHEQEENEHVLLFLRKHFVTNISWLFFGIILIILPPIFFYFLNLSDFFTNLLISPQAYFVLIYAYYLFVFCYMFVNYITWYYNSSLITNIKIVDVHFQDILYHDVSMTKLNLIEDVNYVQSGFFGSLFGYGDVYLETAGKAVRFDFLSIPNPDKVANLLENLIGGSANAE
jgi:hypothetical protein